MAGWGEEAVVGDASAESGLAGLGVSGVWGEVEAAGGLWRGEIADLIDDVEGPAFAFLVDA